MNYTKALATSRKAIESTFDKVCQVYAFESYTKPNGANGKRQILAEEIKCRISAVNLSNTKATEVTKASGSIKLFTALNSQIKGGTRLVVDGVKYVSTHEPMTYPSHMEVVVERAEWL